MYPRRHAGKMTSPAPIKSNWASDGMSIVIGAGHNGLTCAAYLARAGKRVLVLEARKRVGGACTIDEVWPGYRISPCAYLAGLLHPLVIDELDMAGYGFQWLPARAGMFVPFDDGASIQLWDDDALCEARNRATRIGRSPGVECVLRRETAASRRTSAGRR